MQEAANPNNDIESFDTIYNSALQVIVIASANTVSWPRTHADRDSRAAGTETVGATHVFHA